MRFYLKGERMGSVLTEGRSYVAGTWVTGDLIHELATDRLPAGGWHVVDCPGTPFVAARKQ